MATEPTQLPAGCPPLTTYYAYLTSGCNLACQHCWLAPKFQPNGGTGGHLDYDLFVQAVEEGIPLGLGHIKCTGGEPLLHPDFRRFVAFIREKGLTMSLETNGTLMTQDMAQYLRSQNVLTHASVSLDGASAATHDPFRGVKGSFEKACNAVRYLAEVEYHPQVIMSLHRGNVDEIEATARLAAQLGASTFKINIVQASGRGDLMVQRNQTLEFERLLEIGRWMDQYLQPAVGIRVYYNWPMAFYTLDKLVNDKGYSCHILNILGILPTGHLAMCGIGTQIPELCYGIIGQDRIADVWATNAMLLDLRESLPARLDGICADCLFRDRCMGSCVAHNYHLTGRLTAPFWFCEAAEARGEFPASRRRSVPIALEVSS